MLFKKTEVICHIAQLKIIVDVKFTEKCNQTTFQKFRIKTKYFSFNGYPAVVFEKIKHNF